MKQDVAEAIGRYRELLLRYQGTLDLMSPRGLADIDRWLAEAERYAELVRRIAPGARTVLDVGSGAGLPGVMLALRLPGCRVTLAERRRKRSAFLALVAGQLGLANVEVHAGDVRALTGVEFEVVVAQGVGKLVAVVGLTRHLLGDGAVLISRKGPGWQGELAALRAERGTAIAVLAQEALGHRGTLVALRLGGGPGCRSSG